MEQIYTYSHKYLSDEFDNYRLTSKASSSDLTAFFDGFLLGYADKSIANEDLEAMRCLHYYRHFGHLYAHINPLDPQSVKTPITISLPQDTVVSSCGLFEEPTCELEKLIERLRQIYAQSIGYEYLHCSHEVIDFIQKFIEDPKHLKAKLSDLDIYQKLAQAELFETFLHTRFPGQKRFSLEGLETSCVFIQESLVHAEALGYKNIVFGMAHRGRLNLLANIFHKPLSVIFEEFNKDYDPYMGKIQGDVKYHQGAFYKSKEGLNLTLSSNPSHLEAVDPVALGMTYGKQQLSNQRSLAIMIHGDASFAGQGVVYETMQLSKIEGFDAKGVLHIILNNQIGFTAVPKESRSTHYATDLARCFNCPIFHVNSEDIEAMQHVANLALELINRFKIDVMVDIIGYRKWGHNESDEPSFTQPLLYKKLKNFKNPLELFKQKLLSKDPSLKDALATIETNIKEHLQKQLESKQAKTDFDYNQSISSSKIKIDPSDLKLVAEHIFTIPQDFHIHPKLLKLFNERKEVIEQNGKLDFAQAELLALGMTLKQNKSVRLVGQDSARGTFSQRHAVLVDQETEARYNIFKPLLSDKNFCQIINSPLSEYAVLGFEYGFSKESIHSLNLWEAQFGDFANGAQIIIDQFIASGRTKWQDRSNLTMLLPHGYEGQGPEHTSARIERFLELCAQNNMIVAIPSNPKQYFHLLVNQSDQIVPCVIFTPKALLRHPDCKSDLIELSTSSFEDIIDDGNLDASVIVLTYGKIYIDLKNIQKAKNLKHISILSLEKLYPLDFVDLKNRFNLRKHLKKIVLVQDEPMNMGAYSFLKMHLDSLDVIARKPASSPAAGYYKQHETELKDILTQFENL